MLNDSYINVRTHNVEGTGKKRAMVKTLINDAICDLGNIAKQRTMILGPAMERENRDRGRGVGDAMLDVANKNPYDNAEE